MEAPAGTDNTTDAIVAREDNTGVEDSCDACMGWGRTSSPATEAGFCNPTPSTAREEHAVDGLQCHVTRYPHAKGMIILQVLLKEYPVQPGGGRVTSVPNIPPA